MYYPTTALKKIARFNKAIRVVQGGQGAGKTIGILMLLLNRAMLKGLQEITIIQAELSKLKKTAMRDFQKILKANGLWNIKNWNKTDSIYTFDNGSYIEFIGLDRSDIGKGFRRDLVYFNELNKGKITIDTFIQFSSRSSITYADYNPDRNFWLHDEIIPDIDTDFLILTHNDNEYLRSGERKVILKYKEKGFHLPDLPIKDLFDEDNIKSKYWANKHRVYGLGIPGTLDGVVFDNWRYGEFNPNKLQTICGMDFGFSVDPDTLTEVAIDMKRKRIYLKEHIFRTGLRTNELAALILSKVGSKKIISEVDPRLVADLRFRKVNIEQHVKGLIEVGISMMLDFTIIVAPDSKNLGEEFRNHIYADKGSKLYEDSWNHGIDGSRYAIEYVLRRPNKGLYKVGRGSRRNNTKKAPGEILQELKTKYESKSENTRVFERLNP